MVSFVVANAGPCATCSRLYRRQQPGLWVWCGAVVVIVGALSSGITNWGSGAMWGCEVECWGLNGNEFASVGVCAVCGRFCLDFCGLRVVGILFFVQRVVDFVEVCFPCAAWSLLCFW